MKACVLAPPAKVVPLSVTVRGTVGENKKTCLIIYLFHSQGSYDLSIDGMKIQMGASAPIFEPITAWRNGIQSKTTWFDYNVIRTAEILREFRKKEPNSRAFLDVFLCHFQRVEALMLNWTLLVS